MSMSAIQVRVRTEVVAKTPTEPTLAIVMLDMVGNTVNKVWPGIPLSYTPNEKWYSHTTFSLTYGQREIKKPPTQKCATQTF